MTNSEKTNADPNDILGNNITDLIFNEFKKSTEDMVTSSKDEAKILHQLCQ